MPRGGEPEGLVDARGRKRRERKCGMKRETNGAVIKKIEHYVEFFSSYRDWYEHGRATVRVIPAGF